MLPARDRLRLPERIWKILPGLFRLDDGHGSRWVANSKSTRACSSSRFSYSILRSGSGILPSTTFSPCSWAICSRRAACSDGGNDLSFARSR